VHHYWYLQEEDKKIEHFGDNHCPLDLVVHFPIEMHSLYLQYIDDVSHSFHDGYQLGDLKEPAE
jgi:hypothetical protein